MYVMSDMVQEGGMWPLQPVHDIIQNDRLQEGEGLYRAWIYIVSDVVQKGAA
jgi:hypothetical protein